MRLLSMYSIQAIQLQHTACNIIGRMTDFGWLCLRLQAILLEISLPSLLHIISGPVQITDSAIIGVMLICLRMPENICLWSPEQPTHIFLGELS